MKSIAFSDSLVVQIYQLSKPDSGIKIPCIVRLLVTLLIKSVDFKTRKCYRDGGCSSPASLEEEMIAYLDVETALRCCQKK